MTSTAIAADPHRLGSAPMCRPLNRDGQRGLSRLQATILALALRQYERCDQDGQPPARLYVAQILAAYYAWPLTTRPSFCPVHRRPIVDASAIQPGQYAAAHAVSRALRRLRERGLVDVLRYVEGHRLKLTAVGVEVAQRLAAVDQEGAS